MKIMGLGVGLTGRQLFPTVDEKLMADALVGALERNGSRMESITSTTSKGVSFRGELERRGADPGDPRDAGWTFLVSTDDPQLEELQRTIKPLAEHRGMEDPQRPLIYRGDPHELLQDYYGLQLAGVKVPQYALILGGPNRVPFFAQSLLDTVAKVGRLEFNQPEDLQAYVDKVLRIENAADPIVSAEATLFAPDHGLPDPTYFSRKYMAEPLADHIRDQRRIQVRTFLGEEATKAKLREAGRGTPALMFTASHGLGAIHESLDKQMRYNGAICCQHEGPLTTDAIFSADDVPTDEPFLEGSVLFQFACFGYGTPAESDFAHWLDGVPQRYAETEFVASLPKKLLSHPRGPVAYVGHLDTAFLHGFTDAEDPHILDRWHPRVSPFLGALNRLLGVQPCGFAMEDMNARYSVCNAVITNTYDRQQRGHLEWTSELRKRFLDNWILRGDAQNYMVFGDPGVRLRIPAP